ncbi:ACP S-malonyltransferase [Gryllotalpicola sp.]|uniref:ACP S-malonyltransferase n=1 Tax=Gryllotalpicola sp. TaxID=1932787 RepID=UPI00262C5FC7|nr:ACP S-malonyltransferase [Gryllotalpicola sp.]
MIVFACPGQGSQTPGFLEPWLADPELRDLAGSYSAAAGIDIVEHGTVSDADTIRDTAVAQPLIVAAGLITAHALRRAGVRITAVAGHSVGEITAAAIAGVFGEADALRFVRLRALAMAEAAAAVPTGLSAVLGGEASEVIAAAETLGLEPANYNGGGQIVVGGALDVLARLAAEPPRGARVVPLQVAGAFHTRYMAEAREALHAAAPGFAVTDPAITLWTNKDGSTVASGTVYLELLVGQVASPVRWDLDMAAFEESGVTGLVELAPAGTLTGLAKRGLKGLPAVAIKSPDDIPAAVELAGATLP